MQRESKRNDIKIIRIMALDLLDVEAKLNALTYKEKIKYLDDIYSDLEETLNEITHTMEEVTEIRENLQNEQRETIRNSIRPLVENKIHKAGSNSRVSIVENTSGGFYVEVNYDSHKFWIYTICIDAECTIAISLRDNIIKKTERKRLLSSFADSLGYKYKDGLAGELCIQSSCDGVVKIIEDILGKV